MKPFPTELSSPINPEAHGNSPSVEAHRNLYCHHYDGCLDEAVKRGWNSFTCMACPLYGVNNPEKYEGGIEGFATQRRVV